MNKIIFSTLAVLFSFQVIAQVAFFGRDYEEYTKMFCLEEQTLSAKRILDVPAGPSTFLTSLKEKDILDPASRAVDIDYSENRSHLETMIDKGMRRAFNFFYDESFKTWPIERQNWYLHLYDHFMNVHQSFLDYHDRFPELFVQGDIRLLQDQLGSQTFDLILSANLLFLYTDSEKELDEQFHRDAILSMAKVLNKNGEIRITPLDDKLAETPAFLPHLMSDLQKEGLHVEIRESCAPSTGQWIKRLKDARGQMLIVRHNNARNEL